MSVGSRPHVQSTGSYMLPRVPEIAAPVSSKAMLLDGACSAS